MSRKLSRRMPQPEEWWRHMIDTRFSEVLRANPATDIRLTALKYVLCAYYGRVTLIITNRPSPHLCPCSTLFPIIFLVLSFMIPSAQTVLLILAGTVVVAGMRVAVLIAPALARPLYPRRSRSDHQCTSGVTHYFSPACRAPPCLPRLDRIS